MIVDHFSTYVSGGAPMAARRLHDALRVSGVDSRFWYRHAVNAEQLNESYAKVSWPRRRSAIQLAKVQIRRTGIRGRYKRAMNGRPEGLESFTLPELAAPTPYPPGAQHADVVNLHWIANLIDYESFFASIPADLPVVWTLHDMNPFTGGCHYASDCEAFVTTCARCPQISRGAANDLANRNFRMKQKSFENKNLHIVTPSRWLLKEAQKSRLFRSAASLRCIPYGLDTDIFTPVDKRIAKRRLGLPKNQFVVAFVAEEVGNHRKGGKHLLAALSQFAERPVIGLVLGGGKLPAGEHTLPRMHTAGFVRDQKQQALIYAAADVLVLPSLADNLPLTGLEASLVVLRLSVLMSAESRTTSDMGRPGCWLR